MIVRVVKMTFRPGEVEAFRTLFDGWAPRIRESRGCRYLELWQDVADPQVFFTHSHWDSADDLEHYRRSAVFAEVWPVVKPMFALPAEAWSVEVLHRSDASPRV